MSAQNKAPFFFSKCHLPFREWKGKLIMWLSHSKDYKACKV